MSPLTLLLGHKEAIQPPFVIFQGPDKQGQIKALDSAHQHIAHFEVAKNAIFRITNTSRNQICTFKHSSLSGTTTLQIHGREVKMRQSWEGLQYGKDISTPSGKLKWRPGCDGFEELRDERKVLLARGKYAGIIHMKPRDLEVFVHGDEFLLDLILASWISTLKGQKKENEAADGVMEVVGALAGV